MTGETAGNIRRALTGNISAMGGRGGVKFSPSFMVLGILFNTKSGPEAEHLTLSGRRITGESRILSYRAFAFIFFPVALLGKKNGQIDS